jgi:hypothetical protein
MPLPGGIPLIAMACQPSIRECLMTWAVLDARPLNQRYPQSAASFVNNGFRRALNSTRVGAALSAKCQLAGVSCGAAVSYDG